VEAGAARAVLAAGTQRDLLKRLRAPRGARLETTRATVASRPVAKAVHRRPVGLGAVHRTLRNVIAPAVESVLVGASAARAVVLGHLPDPHATVEEVERFVGTLLETGRVEHDPRARRAMRSHRPTHAVRTRGGRKVLVRTRFACC
jgi:hypothetical protein